jgi:hypothetical protein
MADKGRLPLEQGIETVLFLTEAKSAVVTTEAVLYPFSNMMGTFIQKTVHKLYNRFNKDGSMLERKCRQPSSVLSLENIDAIRVLQRSPIKSIRKAAA